MLNIAKEKFAVIAAAATAAVLAPGYAFAGQLADAFEAGVDKGELTAIGLVVLGVCGIVFLIRSARRTA